MDLVFLTLCLCFFAASAIVLYNQAPEKRAPKRSTSIYSPLPPGTGRIRLLRLMPSRNAAAAIECQLFDYHLGSSETTHLYEALSYAWGDKGVMKDICIGEHRFKIRENLHQALLRLRNHSIERILWVDAICIDQKNKLERGDQIRHMVKIYSQASCVIVWLGDAGNNSNQVFDHIRAAAEDGFKNSPGDKEEEKVLDLLDRPWFRRMWVLQEVAAARRILIMCGTSEMNGYAFSLGFNNLEHSYTTHSDLRSLIRSATYLIRSAIFRPRYTAIRSGRASLGELIDLYHTREASERHDKVYALLGMSSEDPSAAGLEPDYNVSWEEVLQRLVKVLISEEVSVQIWNGKMAVIQSKGYILGQVSKVTSDNDQYDKQYVEVIFKALTPSEYREIWTLRSSAKSIQPGDLICCLKGTSKPTIIRAYKDHSTIIVIAVTPLQSEHSKHSGPSVSMESFVRDFLLVWNWENSLDDLQTGEGHKTLGEIDTAVSEYLETASRKAIGLHDVALILRDSGKFKEAEGKLQEAGRRLREAIAVYEEAFDSDREYTLAGIDKLALTYKGQEMWKEAEEWFSQAIRMRKRVKGMNHQDTLNSIANLASSYVAQGRSSAEGSGKMTDLVSRIRDNARIPEDNARIPEAEVAEVAGSFDSRFLSLLLDLWGDNVPITEKVVKAAAGNEEGLQVMELLFERCENNVQITREVVKAAVGNNRYGKDILTLLKQRGGNLSVTQEIVMIAAKNIGSGEGVMKLLLERRENDVWITEGVVQAAAEYLGNAEGIIALLLERGGVGLITEEVVKAAAGNIRNGKEVMKVLLDRTANDIPITDVVVKVVAGNGGGGKEVMELLLERIGDKIKITEEVVKEAVGNKLGGEEIIKLLLERREKDVQITEGVVKAAARNYLTGTSIIELLIKQGGGNIMITEEAIVQIARSFDGRVMTLLFEQRGKDVQITEGVVKAAAEDWLTRTDVMKLLLKQGGDNITSTEEARVQIAKLFDETVMALLFERRGNVLITERMVKAAARNKENGKEVMEFLLKRKSEIVVTEGVVRAAARNTESGEEVMILLLKQKRDDVHIKEEAAVLIRKSFSDAVTALLPERRGTTSILQDEYYS